MARDASLDSGGLRQALTRKVGVQVDDARWAQVVDHLDSLGSHEPYDDDDLEDALKFWRQSDRTLNEAAAQLRLRLTGFEGEGLLRTIVAEAGNVALDYAIWMRGGPMPPERHFDESAVQTTERLIERTTILSVLPRLTIAVQVLADQQHVSFDRAYSAIWGVPPVAGAVTHRSFFADAILSAAADYSALALKSARSRSWRLRHAVGNIRAMDPNASWMVVFAIYQRDWVPLGYPDYVNHFEAFKKATQRALNPSDAQRDIGRRKR